MSRKADSRRTPRRKAASDRRDIHQLAEMLRLPSFETIDELNLDYYGEAGAIAAREAAEEGEDEEEAATAAESAAADEVYRKWRSGVESVATNLLDKHHLTLVPTKTPDTFRIQADADDWRRAADELRRTINGVGEFTFYTLEDFLESGPYTPRQAVLSHLNWIRRYPEVYSGSSPQSMFDHFWR